MSALSFPQFGEGYILSFFLAAATVTMQPLLSETRLILLSSELHGH
jgi:hypothetical protein